MSKTDGDFRVEGATDIRKRNFDRCPNCGVHSNIIVNSEKMWKCENPNCRVRYFNHE